MFHLAAHADAIAYVTCYCIRMPIAALVCLFEIADIECIMNTCLCNEVKQTQDTAINKMSEHLFEVIHPVT